MAILNRSLPICQQLNINYCISYCISIKNCRIDSAIRSFTEVYEVHIMMMIMI